MTIPSGVTSIGEAFSGCNALTDVYYGGTLWASVRIDGYNTKLTSATIHYNSSGAAILSFARAGTSAEATVRVAAGITGAKALCAAREITF